MEKYRGKRVSLGKRWPRWLPAALLLAAIALDLARTEFNTFPLLAAALVAAAPVLSLAGTLTIEVAASLMGLLFGYLERRAPLFSEATTVAFASIAFLTVIAAFLNQAFAHER
ncbi:hypothetical protein ACH4D4_11060 [Streptomyces pristinaespiralis]|uniref:hypothetical protein n=1 Tax=Streptomyces pristinaespiralis TaxID=38300 RepID=UPI0037A7A486